MCGPITEHRSWRDLLAFERRGATPDNRLEQETMLNRLLCELAGGLEEPRSERPSERVRAFLEELPRRVHEPWSLDRAAAGVGISRRRFSELFRDAAGDSFVTTVQKLRVKSVQDLLATEAHSIVGAAYACGFEDLAHFYRVFRRHTGVAPGAWLEARVHRDD
jgi:transcriptional regulator GlxA family with amidase domain